MKEFEDIELRILIGSDGTNSDKENIIVSPPVSETVTLSDFSRCIFSNHTEAEGTILGYKFKNSNIHISFVYENKQ